MKKFYKLFLFVFTLVSFLSNMFFIQVAQAAPTADTKNMVFVYVGLQNSTTAYTSPNNSLFEQSSGSKLSNVNEYVLCSGSWDAYKDSSNPLDQDKNGTKCYKRLADSTISVIKQITNINHSAKIWISTPGLKNLDSTGEPNTYNYSAKLLPIYKNYFNYIKTAIASTVWTNNILGVYENSETIFNDISLSNLYSSNKQVQFFSDLDMYFSTSTFGFKKFLWVPTIDVADYCNNPDGVYAPANGSKLVRIAIVANQTNIFNYVLLQPHYYFSPSFTWKDPTTNIHHTYNYYNNLYVVKNSVTAQKILNYNGSYLKFGNTNIVKLPNISTQIGIQMEMDNNVNTNSRYNDYVKEFNNLTSIPYSYYAGGPDTLNKYDVYTKINSYYRTH
ncbi:MAG: hypothetical protein Q8900_03860 [Bacillota bacterium]|nr:hypothetical protein [Bacillota bacterium]